VGADGGRWKLSRSEPVTLRQFGATGDGSTDDTTAVQAALTWGGTAGEGIYATAGNYSVSPLTIPAGLPLFRGTGGATLTLRSASFGSGQRMIDARSNTAELSIGGFALVVDDAAFDATWTLDLTSSTQAFCSDIIITGSGAFGIIFQGGTGIRVHHCDFTGTNGGFGGCVYGNSQVANAYQYVASDITCAGVFNYGVQLGGDGVRTSEAHLISGCKAEGAAGASFAFSLTLCNYSSIVNCFSKNSNHEAFQLTDTYYCSILGCRGEWTSTNGTDIGISINGTAVMSRFNTIASLCAEFFAPIGQLCGRNPP